MLRHLLTSLAVFPLLALGCGDDHDHGGSGGHSHSGLSEACADIMEACHEKDTGDPGVINDCHTKAHDNVKECATLKDQCVAACDAAPLADAGAGGAAGHAG